MQDTKLFETILGLSGWRMIRRGGRVRTAARSLAGFDHAEERTWRHLFFTRWYGWAVRSRLEPVKEVAATLKRHLDGVLRFVKPITNGVADGLNSKIMSIKRKAGGFRNPPNFTTAIYFDCGGLDLCPTLIPDGSDVLPDQKRIESGQSERSDYDVSSTLTMAARIEIVLESLFRISMSDSQ